MVWMVCAAFAGGLLVGVFLMALLFASRQRTFPSIEGVEDKPVQFPFLNGNSCGIWHLTPRGWVLEMKDQGVDVTSLAPPDNRVLSCACRKELLPVPGYTGQGMTEIWRCEDAERVSSLLKEFGEPPPAAPQ